MNFLESYDNAYFRGRCSALEHENKELKLMIKKLQSQCEEQQKTLSMFTDEDIRNKIIDAGFNQAAENLSQRTIKAYREGLQEE